MHGRDSIGCYVLVRVQMEQMDSAFNCDIRFFFLCTCCSTQIILLPTRSSRFNLHAYVYLPEVDGSVPASECSVHCCFLLAWPISRVQRISITITVSLLIYTFYA
jgi:hypothetical protein